VKRRDRLTVKYRQAFFYTETFFLIAGPNFGRLPPGLKPSTPAPPNANCDAKQENIHRDADSAHVDVGIINIIVPSAVIPTPTHHHLSGLYGSLGLRIVFAFLFNGSIFSPVESCMSRLTLLLPVDWAPPVALAVGFRVCVGSISGGLYSRNIGI
jgi:hypothetical protein